MEVPLGKYAIYNNTNLAQEWQKSPQSMERRLYLEEMTDILKGVKVYIVPDKSAQSDSVQVIGR